MEKPYKLESKMRLLVFMLLALFPAESLVLGGVGEVLLLPPLVALDFDRSMSGISP